MTPDQTQIFVRLIGEGVDVWRPIQAEHRFGNIYRIADQTYDRETETWEFDPCEEVVCEMIDSSDGQILAATHLRKS
jgi:hypothetical protein